MFPSAIRALPLILVMVWTGVGLIHATPGVPTSTEKPTEKRPGAPVVAGVVMDKERKPVAGAKVLLATAAVREGTSPLCPSCYPDCAKSAVTDAEGRFRIEGVDDALVFNVLVAAPGYRPAYARKTDPRKGVVMVKLEKSQRTKQTLRGRVLDPEGRPVFGALVEPAWFDRGDGGRQIGGFPGDDLAVSDTEGMFELTTSSPEVKNVGVVIRAPQLARRIFTPLATGETVHEYKLDRGVTVRGRLVRDGVPVPNVNVTIVQVDRNAETSLGPQTIGTDVSGKFELTNVPAGDYWTLCTNRDTLPEGSVTGTQEVMTTAPDSEVTLPDLAVETGLPVRGQVVLTDGKMPPAGTRVLISREGSWDPQTREVDERGGFAFTARSDDAVSFYAQVAGYSDGNDPGLGRENFWRPEGKKPMAEVRLVPLGQIPTGEEQTGTVFTPDGKPASGARIGVAESSQLLVVENGVIRSGAAAKALADEAGHFSLRLAPGRQVKDGTLMVLHESGWAVTTLEKTGEITLLPWGRVEGVAREGANPRGNQPVVLKMSLAFDGKRAGVFFEERMLTGADGAFVIERVPAGLARLGISTGRRWILETHPLKIGFEVKAGETERVKLGGTGAIVRGKVNIPDEVRRRMDPAQVHAALSEQPKQRPAANDHAAQLDWMTRQREHNFAVNEDGTFEIPDVEPGDYILHVTFPEVPDADDRTSSYSQAAGLASGRVKVAEGDTEVVANELICNTRKAALKPGDEVPDFAAQTSTGEKFTKSSLKGRMAVVIFSTRGDDTATVLRALASLPEDQRPITICASDGAVAGEPEPPAPPPWVASVSHQTLREIAEAFGVQRRPSYYVFSRNGKVASLSRSAEDAVRAVATAAREER